MQLVVEYPDSNESHDQGQEEATISTQDDKYDLNDEQLDKLTNSVCDSLSDLAKQFHLDGTICEDYENGETEP